MGLVAVLKELAPPVEKEVPALGLPVEKVADIVGKSKTEVPPSIYEKISGKPYLVDKLRLDCWEELKSLKDEVDVDKIKDKTRKVEAWIVSEIDRKGYEDTLESYDRILEGLFSELNITPNVKREEKLERLSLWIDLMAKQRKLDEQRRKILAID